MRPWPFTQLQLISGVYAVDAKAATMSQTKVKLIVQARAWWQWCALHGIAVSNLRENHHKAPLLPLPVAISIKDFLI